MIKYIFAIYDSKANAFCEPVFTPNQAIAERSFTIASNDKTTYIGQSPTDYTLFRLGTWDDESGKFDLLDTPESLMLASSTIKETSK
ncbi:MAG: nonstructural protein [Arizlama microvirus]|nr:MAG: nonstructural protein [Arizlama microvirus]